MNHYRNIIALVAAVALVKGCGDGDSPTVPPPEPIRPTTITVVPTTAELTALGTTVQLTAEVRDQNGGVMAGVTITWTSSDASVATVDASGLVTAEGNGMATITATAGTATGSAVVTVTQSVVLVEVSPPATELTALGETVQLAAEAFDANGQVVGGAEVSWTSSDSSVAAVDASGLVTAEGNGMATITATAGTATGSAVVTVTQSVVLVEVSPPATELTALGETVQLAAEAFDANGQVVGGAEVSWTSSDSSVAAVDASGLVTAEGNGMATITATAGTATGSAVVTVTQSVVLVEVSPPATELTALGETVQLAAEAFDANGQVVGGAEVSWTSSDSSVAAVDASGLVTAEGNGMATITATAGTATGSAVVTVTQSVVLVEVSPPATELTALGETVQLAAEAFDANGQVVGGAEVSWTSSDSSVAAVDASGLVTAVGNGEATITANVEASSGSAEITVMEAPAPAAIVIETIIDRNTEYSYECSRVVCRDDGFTRRYNYLPAGDTIRVENYQDIGATVYDQYGHKMVQDLDVEWHLTDSIRYESRYGSMVTMRPSDRPRWLFPGCLCHVVWLSNGNRHPRDPVWSSLVASLQVSDSLTLADTATVLVPARMSFDDFIGDLGTPFHMEVGGSIDIDMTGLFVSPRGLPVTYEVRAFDRQHGAPRMPDTIVRLESRDNVISVHGVADGVVGLAITVRTEQEYLGYGDWRGVYVGSLPCPAIGVQRAPSSRFRIELSYSDDLAPCVRSTIEGAVGWWENALTDTELSESESCGVDASTLEISVETMIFHRLGGPVGGAFVSCIDPLSRAGTLLLSEQIFLGWNKDPRFHSPAINLMYQVARHEIGHVLGLVGQQGTLVEGDHFIGARAVAEFRRLGGTAEGVPLERNDRAHWSNDELGGELMTPSIGFARVPPVSAITLGALVDIGWTVDMSAAEAYEVGQPQLYSEGEGLVVFDGLDRQPKDAVPENAAACNFTKSLCGLHEVFGLPVGLGPARTGRRCRMPKPSRLTTRSSWRPR